MWSYDPAMQQVSNGLLGHTFGIPELRASVRQTDANAGCHCPFERPDTLRPDNWICTSGAGNGDDQTEVTHDWVVDCEKDDVADYGCCFDCCCQ